jgi:hypothetical protein
MSKAAEKRAEQTEAIEKLREIFPPGSTVHTVLRHVSHSDMLRAISVLVAGPDGIDDVSYLVARAVEMTFDRNHGGVKVTGCGMDMGYHLAHSLSRVLYRDRDHDGRSGYVLKHRWV